MNETPAGTGTRRERNHLGDRLRMVEEQIARAPGGRMPVRDPRVLDAMRIVPRHRFLPNPDHPLAYGDGPLALDHGQTISQPYIVAIMTDQLDLSPADRVLEVGTGSGYQAAVLAHLTPHVYTVEAIPELAERADATLAELGYDTVQRRLSDGATGWPGEAPFDAILVACSMRVLPPELWAQLRTGGRLVAPFTTGPHEQKLFTLVKGERHRHVTRPLFPVSFVPMTGASQASVPPSFPGG